ncbi:hypothetical protein [Rothia nasimurium]|uniref:hypothetical protein n=1 Tax=Rothia nasimurium TaxID=85336 RepID=UPI003B9E20FF
MVAVLLRLKLAHFLASFRKGNVWSIIGLIFGLLYGLGIAISFGVAGFFIENPENSLLMIGLLGAAMTLAWWILPLVAAGADPTLDPERLAPYPIRVRQLMGGQALGAFLGTPGIITLLLTLALTTANFYQPLALVAYLPAALLGLALVVVGSRLVAVASIPLRSRRAVTNSLTLLFLALLMMAGPIIGGISSLIFGNPDLLRQVVEIGQWTPLMSAWAIAPAVGTGNYGQAAALSGISLIYLAVLWFTWHFFAAKTMANIGQVVGGHQKTKTHKTGHLGLLGRFPATPRGAITARVLGLMLKDTRFNANILMVPLFYLLFIFMQGATFVTEEDSVTVDNPIAPFMLIAFLPAFSGIAQAGLVSMENSAFALHVLAPLKGIDDRLGRTYAMCLVYVPLLVLGTLTFGYFSEAGWLTVNYLLITLGVFFFALGMANTSDTVFNAPVVPPGSSPWKTPEQPDGMAKAMVRGLLVLIPLGIGLLGYIGTTITHFTANPAWAWGATALVVLAGSLSLVIGIRRGAHRFDQHSAAMLQRVSRYG